MKIFKSNNNLNLIFLLPYSQDLNPNRKIFGYIENNTKKIDKNNKKFKDSIYKL